MEIFERADKRTHYCANLNASNIGERVCVLGWCQKQRDLGALIFIDLRDRTGIVQLAFDEDAVAFVHGEGAYLLSSGRKINQTLCYMDLHICK